MSNLKNPIEIDIKSNWLQSGYFVYIAVIKYEKKKYLYVGQTGDNNYITARSPLYRIGGHFTKYKSTQNQIIEGFKNHFFDGKKVSEKQLEQALLRADIKYYFWRIFDFEVNANEEQHLHKRKQAQFIEHALIWRFQKQHFILFNKKVKNEISPSNKKFFKNNTAKLNKYVEDIFNYFSPVEL